jgi:hypothetical protein
VASSLVDKVEKAEKSLRDLELLVQFQVNKKRPISQHTPQKSISVEAKSESIDGEDENHKNGSESPKSDKL